MTLNLTIGALLISIGLLQPLKYIGENYILITGKLKITLPKNLKRVSDLEIADRFTILSQRPSYIFEDKSTGVKFTINYGVSNALDEQLPQIKTYFEKLYRSSMSDFGSSDLKNINQKPVVLMKFKTLVPKGTEKQFNFLFITTINGKLFMANYSFPTQIQNQEKIAVAVLHSLKIKD